MDAVRARIGELRRRRAAKPRGPGRAARQGLPDRHDRAPSSPPSSAWCWRSPSASSSIARRWPAAASCGCSAGEVGLGQAMLGDKTVEQLSGDILDFLTAYTGAQASVLFKGEHGVFQRMATLGVPADAEVPERFAAERRPARPGRGRWRADDRSTTCPTAISPSARRSAATSRAIWSSRRPRPTAWSTR